MVDAETLAPVEALLFERYALRMDAEKLPMVFILGSPRTGSTLLYQLLINVFGFFYFSNMVNDHFPEHPVVGAALDHILNLHKPIDYSSDHGKTEGPFGPSEASLLFRHWFGGEHPSQTQSARVMPEKSEHLRLTMQSLYAISGRPILTKNAWNCFRVQALVELFPAIHFVWVRRDIVQSAWSDLKARHLRGGPTVWNSATTANYRDIQKLPYWEQVVEQQYAYNESIALDLALYAPGRFCEIWYEDVCRNPATEIQRLREHWTRNHLLLDMRAEPPLRFSLSTWQGDESDDFTKICGYVGRCADRFHHCRRADFSQILTC
jgi:hypothetical protein